MWRHPHLNTNYFWWWMWGLPTASTGPNENAIFSDIHLRHRNAIFLDIHLLVKRKGSFVATIQKWAFFKVRFSKVVTIKLLQVKIKIIISEGAKRVLNLILYVSSFLENIQTLYLSPNVFSHSHDFLFVRSSCQTISESQLPHKSSSSDESEWFVKFTIVGTQIWPSNST